MFNKSQFKPPKVKKVYTGPPRPNLLSHEKRMKESQIAFEELQHRVQMQSDEITTLKTRLITMQHSIDILIDKMRRSL